MAKRLRKRIIFSLSGILLLILLLIEAYFWLDTYQRRTESEYILLDEITDMALEGRMDKMEDENGKWFVPVYVCQMSESGEAKLLRAYSEESYTHTQIKNLAEAMYSTGEDGGIYGNFRYYYKDGILSFLDRDVIMGENLELLKEFAMSLAVGLLLIIGVSSVIANWLVKPVERTFEQQKQFVSDVSHELKTPLAVISLNARKLKQENGDSRWLGYILEENKRMGKLLNELLLLAKVENAGEKEPDESVDISRAVLGAILPYESIAFEKGVEFYLDIEEDIFLRAEEEQIKQLVVILTDNALSHVSEKGQIRVKLKTEKNRVCMEVSNTGEPIPKEEQKKIFERFYRSDKARSRGENRYGLGLAIARSIAQRHGGTIHVECDDGWTTFVVLL